MTTNSGPSLADIFSSGDVVAEFRELQRLAARLDLLTPGWRETARDPRLPPLEPGRSRIYRNSSPVSALANIEPDAETAATLAIVLAEIEQQREADRRTAAAEERRQREAVADLPLTVPLRPGTPRPVVLRPSDRPAGDFDVAVYDRCARDILARDPDLFPTADRLERRTFLEEGAVVFAYLTTLHRTGAGQGDRVTPMGWLARFEQWAVAQGYAIATARTAALDLALRIAGLSMGALRGAEFLPLSEQAGEPIELSPSPVPAAE